MKALGVAVGLFAALTAVGAWLTGDSFLYVVAFVSLLCAVATWASTRISCYLKIFVAIFSTETIVFGLATLGVHAD